MDLNELFEQMLAWSSVLYILLTCILFPITVWIVYRVLRWLWRTISKVAGSDTQTALISLGVATIFFSGVLFTFFNKSIIFTTIFFTEIPDSINRNWQSVIENCYSEYALNCLTSLWLNYLAAWPEAFRTAVEQSGLASLPYNRLLLFFALWALVAVLLGGSQASASTSAGEHGTTRIGETFSRMNKVTRQNLLFFAVLAIAGYLSIAAIVAIPSLQDVGQIPEEVGVDKLREELDALYAQGTIAITEANSISISYGEANPFSDIEQVLSRPEVISDTSPTDIQFLQNTLAQFRGLRQDMLDQYERIITDETSEILAAKQSALTNYEASNVGRAGSFERVQHFLALIGWYQDRIGYTQDRLSNCSDALLTMDNQWQQWATYTSKRIPSGMYDLFDSNDIAGGYYALVRQCRTYQIPSDLPNRPALGSQLGVFSVVASWLLRTESLSLALIVGLVGFGLLGSACSTAIRENKRRRSNEPLVRDLSGVIIRGLLAAVVVFLAVLGGLVIFASEGDPNPYALLLTCLLAAIYSEPVWDWAQRNIHDRFGGQDDRDQEEETPQPEESEEQPTTAETDETPPSPSESTEDEEQSISPEADETPLFPSESTENEGQPITPETDETASPPSEPPEDEGELPATRNG